MPEQHPQPSSGRLLADDVHSVVLEEPVPAGTDVTDGDPTAAYGALGELGPDIEVGVWEMTPGCARDEERDEVFVVLSGHATLGFADGERIDLRPGALVRLHAGDRTEWRVHETLRKLYLSS